MEDGWAMRQGIPFGTRVLVIVLFASLGSLPSSLLAAGACTGSTTWTSAGDEESSPGGNCDGDTVWCHPPVIGGARWLAAPNCDPLVGTCSITVSVPLLFPGNHLNGVDPLYSYATVLVTDSDGGLVGICGNPTAAILNDKGHVSWSFSGDCSDPQAVFNLEAKTCPCFGPTCPFCEATTVGQVELAKSPLCDPTAVAAKSECQECQRCSISNSGTDLGTPGQTVSGPGFGPGATLRYRAGGVGHPRLVGAAAWLPTLGRYWSHDYAQRIIPDPDETHVWLITPFGSFREFSNLAAADVYQTNSPSDEFRELKVLKDGGGNVTGWEFQDLDGTTMHFDGAGLWTENVDRNENRTIATYVSGRLTEVEFPDKRREFFHYHPDGKLAKIEEFGIDGTTQREWRYTWFGDDLLRIDRPDQRAWEFFYEDPAHPGYMTRMELVGNDDESRRVERAWSYDSLGNVIQTWKGDPSFTGPQAVDQWSVSYDDPSEPTLITATDPVENDVIYTLEPMPDGKPLITSITGDCPVCGNDPSAQFQYEDPDHPLLPSDKIDGKGVTTHFEYDDQTGRMTLRREAAGTALERATKWEYQNENFPGFPTANIQESVEGDPSERRTDLEYDAEGNLWKRTISGVESGSFFSYLTETVYNDAGQPETINPPGFDGTDITSFTYDAARGNLFPKDRQDPLLDKPTRFTYDAFNRRIMVTDPNEVQTETQYDLPEGTLDRITAIIQRSQTVNPGDPILEQDLVTEHKYTVLGDLFQTILPEGNIIEYEYDDAGRLTGIVRKTREGMLRERTFYVLDPAGNRITEELQRWDLDANDWATESRTDFVYSTRCQLDKILHPDGSVTEYAYDCNGNLERVWDANHDRAQFPNLPSQEYLYDELNRLTLLRQPWKDAESSPEQIPFAAYEYDVQDHLIKVTDGEGNVTHYRYSDRDLLTHQRPEFLEQPGCMDPDACSSGCGCTTFLYNPHGELIQEVDPRDIVVTREVDELDRVFKVNFVDDSLDIDYLYDVPGSCGETFELGRLGSITRNDQSLEYCYDRFGRATQDGALRYGYDENGNRTQIGYPGSVTATYTYDFADRQETLDVTVDGGVPQPVASGATYKPSGPLASLTLGNGVTETRDFDERYFPESIAVSGGDQESSWNYMTDFIGNITHIVAEGICAESLLLEGETLTGTATFETCGAIVAGNGLVIASGADITFRAGERIVLEDGFAVEDSAIFRAVIDPFISAESTLTYTYQDWQYFLDSAVGPWGELAWTYDKIGNRLTEVRNGETDTYAHVPSNGGNTPLLDSVALSGGGTRAYNFGDAGHLDGVTADANMLDFTTDEAGRLAAIDREFGDSVDLTYDGRSFLKRVEKSLGGGNIGWIQPTYSSEGLIHCLTRQPSPSEPQESFRFFYLSGRPVAQLHRVDGGSDTWTFVTTDHLGTPLLATGPSATEIWTGPFEPFGQDPLRGTSAGALENNLSLRFPGQWEDDLWKDATEGVAPYYNVHRWYEYGTGRYTRLDPIARFVNEVTYYLYVDSQPINSKDPFGLLRVKCEGCDPLIRAQENAARRLFLLRTTGTAIDPIGSNVVSALTGCAEIRLEGTDASFTDTFTERVTGKFPESPCVFLCVGVHERVHRHLCRQLGASVYNAMSERDAETPAYREELRCLKSAIQNGSLGITRRGVTP